MSGNSPVSVKVSWFTKLQWFIERTFNKLRPSKWFWNFVIKLLIKKSKKEVYGKHADKELALLGYDLTMKDKNCPNTWIQENIHALLGLFDLQGHSGYSANYCIKLFTKLAKFEIISPLTGEDNEWNDIGDGSFQNNRLSCVFKDKDGKAYIHDGIIWTEGNGSGYTNFHSRVYIDFPYTLKREYRPASEDPSRADEN